LSLPPDQQNQTWTDTFKDSDYPNIGGTVHWSEYTAAVPTPINWTNTWFPSPDWTWTAQ
jgi:hypothetical protein